MRASRKSARWERGMHSVHSRVVAQWTGQQIAIITIKNTQITAHAGNSPCYEGIPWNYIKSHIHVLKFILRNSANFKNSTSLLCKASEGFLQRLFKPCTNFSQHSAFWFGSLPLFNNDRLSKSIYHCNILKFMYLLLTFCLYTAMNS
jgi:hypothetical protein